MTDPRARVLHHVRRYPKWYGVAALWVLGMLVLPVVELDPLQIFSSPSPATEVAAPPASGAPGTPAGSATPGGSGVAPGSAAPASPATGPPAHGTPPRPVAVPPESIPPELIDELFNLFPPPAALPEIPAELQAIVRAAAPLATHGCTGLGLASLVVAVVAPSAEGIPLERILPYLAPVTSACANFPIPETHTVCAADAPFVLDLGGLATSPPILGLGIDQLTAVEDIIALSFGDSIPRISDAAREALDCRLVR